MLYHSYEMLIDEYCLLLALIVMIVIQDTFLMSNRYLLTYIVVMSLFLNMAFASEYNGEELLKKVEQNQKRVISDGEYDLNKGIWVNKPMINYSFSSSLRPVEFAAKKGGYETAANELLKYYRTCKFKRQELSSRWNQQMVAWMAASSGDGLIGLSYGNNQVKLIELKERKK